MTVHRKPKEEVVVTGKLSLLNYLLGQNGFRGIALLLLLSMHPLGRQILGTFGFKFPDEQKLTVAADKVTVTDDKITGLVNNMQGFQSNVNGITSDLASLKANNAILNAKVDQLTTTFTGFQVDFNNYRNQNLK